MILIKIMRPSLLPLKSSYSRFLRSGVSWLVIASVLSQAIGLVATIGIARILGPVGYGFIAVITAVTSTLAAIGGQGLVTSASRRLSQLRANKDSEPAFATLFLFSVSTALSSVAAALAIPLLDKSVDVEKVDFDVKVFPLLVFIASVSQVMPGLLAGLEAFRYVAVLQILISVVRAIAVLAGALLAGLQGYVWALFFVEMFALIVQATVIGKLTGFRRVSWSWKGLREELGNLVRFALPTYLAGVVLAPANLFCFSVLGASAIGLSDVAVINAAMQWRSLISFIPQRMQQVALPGLCQLRALDQKNEFYLCYRRHIKHTWVVCGIVAAIVMGLSPFLTAMYGAAFARNPVLFPLVIIGVALQCVCRTQMLAIHAGGHGAFDLVLSLVRAVVQVGLFFALKDLSGVGFGLAYVASYVCSFLMGALFISLDKKAWVGEFER